MLKTTKEFDFVYKNSYKFRSESLDICVLRANMAGQFFAKFRRLPCNLIGFSVSKKVGIAVERNLIKRRLRAICQEFFGNSGNLSLGLQFRTCEKNTKIAESALDSAKTQNLGENHAKKTNTQNLICIFIAKGQILQTPFAMLKSTIFATLKKQLNFRQDYKNRPYHAQNRPQSHINHTKANYER